MAPDCSAYGDSDSDGDGDGEGNGDDDWSVRCDVQPPPTTAEAAVCGWGLLTPLDLGRRICHTSSLSPQPTTLPALTQLVVLYTTQQPANE